MPPKPTNVPEDSQEELQPPRAPFAQPFDPNARFSGTLSGGRTVNPFGHGATGDSKAIRRRPLPDTYPDEHAPEQPNPNPPSTSAGTPSQQVGGYGTRATQDIPRNQGDPTNPAAGSDIGDPGFRPPFTQRPGYTSTEAGTQSQPASGYDTESPEYSSNIRAARPSSQRPSARPGARSQLAGGFGTGSLNRAPVGSQAARPPWQRPFVRSGARSRLAGGYGTEPLSQAPVVPQAARPYKQRPSARPGASNQQVGGQRATSTTEVPTGQGGGEDLVPFDEVKANLASSPYSSAVSLPNNDNEMPRKKGEGGYRHGDVSPVRDGSERYMG